MPDFHYTAFDDDGHEIEGTIEALDLEQALGQLAARGLRQITILQQADGETGAVSGDQDLEAPRSAGVCGRGDEQIEVVQSISELVGAELPLAPGLRALSSELPSRRTRRALARIADRLDRGVALDEAVQGQLQLVPADLQVLIHAGLRTGDLSSLLEQYLHYARIALDGRRQNWLMAAYPMQLLLAGLLLMVVIAVWIVPDFSDMFMDFEIELPALTILVLNASRFVTSWWVAVPVGLLGGVVAGWWLLGVLAGPTRQKYLYYLPVVGRKLRLTSMSRFCHLLSLGVSHRVPLPEALRLAGRGSRDPYVQRAAVEMAGDVEGGLSLTQAGMQRRMLPETMHVFEWEGGEPAFSESLQATGDICAARARLQTNFARVALEPLAICSIASLVGLVVIALFLPLVKLLDALS